MDNDSFAKWLVDAALECGATRASVIPVSAVETDASFRKLCEQNVCGNYGKNWMCPPDAGGIEELMAELRTYSWMLVYQTVGDLEDSYDFEGMAEAGGRHSRLTQALRARIRGDARFARMKQLGAGGCRLCQKCGKRTGEPCRHPEDAVPSLEAYGVNVSRLAPAAGMKYINGQNTVTFFGAVLFDLAGPETEK